MVIGNRMVLHIQKEAPFLSLLLCNQSLLLFASLHSFIFLLEIMHTKHVV
jgi:hypothetical protein